MAGHMKQTSMTVTQLNGKIPMEMGLEIITTTWIGAKVEPSDNLSKVQHNPIDVRMSIPLSFILIHKAV